MSEGRPDCRCGVVRPVECLKAGWVLIKDDYWLYFGITVVGVLLASVAPLGILAGPMMCGIYYCLLRRARGQTVKFEMLFRGFDYFVQSLIATLLMMIPMLLIIGPAYIGFFAAMFAAMPKEQGAPPDPGMHSTILGAYGLLILVVLLVSIVINVLFFFTYPLIVDRRLTGVQAVGTSFQAARANFGGVLGLVLLNMLLGLIGSLVCCIGGLFVMPLHFAAIAVAYRAVFPDDGGPASPPDGVAADSDDARLEPLPPE